MVTLRDIENIRRKYLAAHRMDSNDAVSVEKLVEQLKDEDYILDYDGNEEDFFLAISTPFQRSMLKTFGRELVFMDAVHNLNKYGYAMMTLVVRDEFGNGVSVAFGISAVENGARWSQFLTKTFEVSI